MNYDEAMTKARGEVETTDSTVGPIRQWFEDHRIGWATPEEDESQTFIKADEWDAQKAALEERCRKLESLVGLYHARTHSARFENCAAVLCTEYRAALREAGA